MSGEVAADKGIEFTLDGQSACARPGETVLSVAKRHDIQIPTLCHHESVSPQGSCRMCVVEVFWGQRSKLVTSCIYTPYEGDRVETDNDRVRRTRRMVLELLLARCPDVEVLRDLGQAYGVTEVRFPADVESDTEGCILCGLCVRVCAEVVGQNAIGYGSRGMDRVMTTPFGDAADECIGCGACVFICPTDALHYEDVDGRRMMKELKTAVPLLACQVCGCAFATAKQIAKVQDRLRLSDELAQTCPACRGAVFRDAMEQTLGRIHGATV